MIIAEPKALPPRPEGMKDSRGRPAPHLLSAGFDETITQLP